MGFLSRLLGRRYRSAHPRDAHRLVQEGAQFLDVRNRGEYRGGHAQGARNVAMHVLPQQVHSLDPARPVVVICRTGRRSAAAARFLVDQGFTEVHNVTGGSLAWKSSGLPWTE